MPVYQDRAMQRSSFNRKRALSWRDWSGRVAVAGLFIASLLLVLMGRFDNETVEEIGQSGSGVLASIGHFAASPVQATGAFFQKFQESWTHLEQLERLAAENETLKQWQLRAEALESENQRLRKLLKLVPVIHHQDLTAEVLGSMGGPYRHYLNIAAGSQNEVVEGMVVLGDQGLVGKVIKAHRLTSQVMLLTDTGSRIAVVTGKSRERAMVRGLGDGSLELYYLPEDTQIQVGEKIYSSGDGGFMPAGILIGEVINIEKTGVRVAPITDRARLDYVRLRMVR